MMSAFSLVGHVMGTEREREMGQKCTHSLAVQPGEVMEAPVPVPSFVQWTDLPLPSEATLNRPHPNLFICEEGNIMAST